jgi:hypothetical protein
VLIRGDQALALTRAGEGMMGARVENNTVQGTGEPARPGVVPVTR